MCWQDVQINRRTRNVVFHANTTVAKPGNPNRVGLMLVVDGTPGGGPGNFSARVQVEVMNEGALPATRINLLQAYYSEGVDIATNAIVTSSQLSDKATIDQVGNLVTMPYTIDVSGSATCTVIETLLEIESAPVGAGR